MTGPVVIPLHRRRTAAAVVTELHGRVQLVLSLCNHRKWCEHCRPNVDLMKRALLGASIEELAKEGTAE